MAFAKVVSMFCAFQYALGINHELFKLMNENVDKFQNEVNEFKEFSRLYHKKEDECWHCRNLNHTEAAKDIEEFDFIIVGGGTSGSALANRLSEIPEWKILVLEAGAPESEVSTVPSLHPYLQTTPMNWGYSSIPQKHCCLGNKDHRCSLATGKALGGSSSINNLIYTRGNHRDYDKWADKGLIGWCWQSVFPFFKKIEDSHLCDFDRKYHRQGGPLWIEHFKDEDECFIQHFLNAAHELGYKHVDYNGKEQLGFAHPQVIIKKGIRQSAATAYLDPIHERKNIVIRPLCHVTKILISPHTKEAYGVEYVHDGKLFVAKATKEILVAAGTLNTPKLLLLSGIGPKEEVEKHSFSCLSDIKVGHNLKDQFRFLGLNFVFNSSVAEKHHYDEILDYLRHGKGPLTHVGGSLLGFVKSELSREREEYPDIELTILKNIFHHGYDQIRHMNIKHELYEAMWKHLEGKEGFTIVVTLLHPKSHGKVFLYDKDPLRDPLIDINAFTDVEDQDIEVLLAGIKLALKLAHTEHFQKLGAHLNHHQVPECEHYKFASDEYWKCAIKYLGFSSNRYTGTCKMGLEEDKEAVVDEHLKVYGVNGLRVVDASVIPVTISGDIMGATLMIAENCAEMVKNEWIR